MKGAQDEQAWRQFLAVAGVFLLAERPASGMRFSTIEKHLRALENTQRTLEPMLQWIFREVRLGKTPLLLQNPDNVKHWYEAKRGERGFNLMEKKWTAEKVIQEVRAWARRRPAAGIKPVAIAPQQVFRTWNRRVMGFKDGYSWRATRPGPTTYPPPGTIEAGGPRVAKRIARWNDIQAVGAILKHCYGGRPAGMSDDRYTKQYGESFTLMTLFGPNGAPHVTIALATREVGSVTRISQYADVPPIEHRGRTEYYVTECKGKGNVIPVDDVSQYTPYIVAVLTRLIPDTNDWGTEGRMSLPPEPVDTAPILQAFPKRTMVFPDGSAWMMHPKEKGDSRSYFWMGLKALGKTVARNTYEASGRYGIEPTHYAGGVYDIMEAEHQSDTYVYFNAQGQPRCAVWVKDKTVTYIDTPTGKAPAAGESRTAKPLSMLLRKVIGRPSVAWGAGLLSLSQRHLTPELLFRLMLLDSDLRDEILDSDHPMAGAAEALRAIDEDTFSDYFDEPDLFSNRTHSIVQGEYSVEAGTTGDVRLIVDVKNWHRGSDGAEENMWHWFHKTDEWKALERSGLDWHDVLEEAYNTHIPGPAHPGTWHHQMGVGEGAMRFVFAWNLLDGVDLLKADERTFWEAVEGPLREVDAYWDYWSGGEEGDQGYASDLADVVQDVLNRLYDALDEKFKDPDYDEDDDVSGQANRRRRSRGRGRGNPHARRGPFR